MVCPPITILELANLALAILPASILVPVFKLPVILLNARLPLPPKLIVCPPITILEFANLSLLMDPDNWVLVIDPTKLDV